VDGRQRLLDGFVDLHRGRGENLFAGDFSEQLLLGEVPGEAVFAAAAVKVDEAIEEPLSDVHASSEYRRHLARVLTRRGLAEAAGRVA